MAKAFDDLVKKTTSKRVQERASVRARRYLAQMLLSELRKQRGMSQKQLAATLKIKQPSLSKLEAQNDMHISTLKKIVQALGGRLTIKAEFPQGETELKQFRNKHKPYKELRPRRLAS